MSELLNSGTRIDYIIEKYVFSGISENHKEEERFVIISTYYNITMMCFIDEENGHVHREFYSRNLNNLDLSSEKTLKRVYVYGYKSLNEAKEGIKKILNPSFELKPTKGKYQMSIVSIIQVHHESNI